MCEREGMKKQVYIRVDGNEMIATGHVMRCLTIAEQLRKRGAKVIFILADARPAELLISRGFNIDVLNTVWNNLEQETEILCTYIEEHNVEVLLLDSYYVTEFYLQELSRYTKIIYIDDVKKFAYPVDTVINYDAFSDVDCYKKLYVGSDLNPDFLLGSYYVPLREEFVLKTFQVKEKINKILITTGGTDQLDVVGNLLKTIVTNSELCQMDYHVIVGKFNQNTEELYLLAGIYPNIHLHHNVNNMAEWMRGCDVAVSAAGTTIYELCACGIPSICFEVADNQEGAKKWEENGYMIYAGNAYVALKQCIENCQEALLYYKNHVEERKEMSTLMQSLIDGYGAKRIAEYILGRIGNGRIC